MEPVRQQPLYTLVGGRCRERIEVYGHGMMLRRDTSGRAERFAEEAAAIEAAGFRATRMKVGLGPRPNIELVRAVRGALRPETRLMVDANHCHTTADALQVGRAMDELDI